MAVAVRAKPVAGSAITARQMLADSVVAKAPQAGYGARARPAGWAADTLRVRSALLAVELNASTSNPCPTRQLCALDASLALKQGLAERRCRACPRGPEGGLAMIRFAFAGRPDRGFDAVVIGEPQRAFYGNQFGLTFPDLSTTACNCGSPRSAAPSIPSPKPTT